MAEPAVPHVLDWVTCRLARLLTSLAAFVLALVAGAGALAGLAPADSTSVRPDAGVAWTVQPRWGFADHYRDGSAAQHDLKLTGLARVQLGQSIPESFTGQGDQHTEVGAARAVDHMVSGPANAAVQQLEVARPWSAPPVWSGVLATAPTGQRAPPRH